MAGFDTIDDVFHRIRIRLCRSNLPRAKGRWLARTANASVLSIEEVCAALKQRGGYTGNYRDLVVHVKEFFDEMAYQLCDGFAVNTGYFTIRPAVGGSFDRPHPEAAEVHDREKHPLMFHFQARAPLRNLSRFIAIEVEEGKNQGFIEHFIDIDSGTTNERLTSGGLFIIEGAKIKVAGGSADCGVWFVSNADVSRPERFKVLRGLTGNTGGKVSGRVPALPAGEYRVEINTQYTVGGKPLKEPRTITGGFVLTAQRLV